MHTEPQTSEALEEVRDKLALVDVAMVSYRSPEGELRSEPLQTARMDKEGLLWFFVHEDQPLVTAIAHRPEINLVYVSDREGIYISIAGRASLLRNRDLQQSLWERKLKRWFPHGPTERQASLLKVEVSYCEYWDEPKSNLFRMMLKAVNAAAQDEEVASTHRRISVEPERLRH